MTKRVPSLSSLKEVDTRNDQQTEQEYWRIEDVRSGLGAEVADVVFRNTVIRVQCFSYDQSNEELKGTCKQQRSSNLHTAKFHDSNSAVDFLALEVVASGCNTDHRV